METVEEIFLAPWAELEARFEVLRALKGCPQDPVFHAEGDVYTHTRRVVEALEALPPWQALPPRARAIVRAGALFHDIGKPACTVEQGGRVSSKNHAQKGARLVRRILYCDATIPFEEREAIVGLVLLHGLPATFYEKPDPVRSVIRASLLVRCDWLALLATADSLGRICTEADGDRTECIRFFEEFSAEQGCAHGPRAFPSERARRLYFANERRECLNWAPYDDTRCEAVLLSGLPAAGKDTVAATRFRNLPVVSLDRLREQLAVGPEEHQGPVLDAAREETRAFLREGRPFVWNATNLTRHIRTPLVSLCEDYGARVRMVYVEAPHAEVLERNRQRAHPVPEHVIESLIDKLEIPGFDEADAVEYATGNGLHRISK